MQLGEKRCIAALTVREKGVISWSVPEVGHLPETGGSCTVDVTPVV